MIAEVTDLPVIQPDETPRERADAARNRARILEAAAALVAEHGIEDVSMEDVARAACVGTGTLYRRFGDRAGLALALLDAHTRAFQNALIAGPPPLGPGAPPAERLRAFGDGYIDLVERHAPLLIVAVPQGRYADGPHTMYTTHLAILLRDGRAGRSTPSSPPAPCWRRSTPGSTCSRAGASAGSWTACAPAGAGWSTRSAARRP